MRSFSIVILILAMISAGCSTQGGNRDETPPTASITMSSRAVLAWSAASATISFSEEVGDFTLSDLAVSGATVGSFANLGNQAYLVTLFADGAGATEIHVRISSGCCSDAAGNGLGSAAEGSVAIAYAPWASATGTDAYGVWADLSVTATGGSAVQRFRLVAPGTFTMGSPVDEPGREAWEANERQHPVSLTSPYWFAESECSQRLWKAIRNSNPSSFTAGGLDLPVETVSWLEVQTFLSGLNGSVASLHARLPTEAEWEYAARSGTTAAFGQQVITSADLNCQPSASDAFVTAGLYRAQTVTVGSLPPNPWGLREMHGNVWEWCSDWYQTDLGSALVVDPVGPASGSWHLVRGGSWINHGQDCRASIRNANFPTTAASYIGFRIAIPAAPAGNS